MLAVYDPNSERIVDYANCIRLRVAALDETIDDASAYSFVLADAGSGWFSVYEPSMESMPIANAPTFVRRVAECMSLRRALFEGAAASLQFGAAFNPFVGAANRNAAVSLYGRRAVVLVEKMLQSSGMFRVPVERAWQFTTLKEHAA